MKRRTALGLIASLPFARLAHGQTPGNGTRFSPLLNEADGLSSLKAVIVSIDGEEVASRAYHGASLMGSTNIKSASKSVISALVGMAIDRKMLAGADQPMPRSCAAIFRRTPMRVWKG
ncbi:UNVERIFIED_ORG: hypothetical protein J2740_001828 [Rhizobium nepotum]|nr:hypothetical protein [Rhizobium nepotum]